MIAGAGTGRSQKDRGVAPSVAGKPGTARSSGDESEPANASKRGRPREWRPRTGTEQNERVLIELTKSQVDQVVRSAARGGTMSVLLSALRDPEWTIALQSEDLAYQAQMEDRSLSRSLLSGLLVLSCFEPDGDYLGISELARMLEMTASTTHRYVTTLLAVGLLERHHDTRKYRLAHS